MKFIRFCIIYYGLFPCANAHALELNYDGVDYITTNYSPPQSRIIVTNQIVTGSIGDFFTVKVEARLPSSDRTNVSCVDTLFRLNGSALPQLFPNGIEGYALYSLPFLYVFVEGLKFEAAKNEHSYEARFCVKHAFVYLMTADNNFTLLREEWLGAVQSGLTLYNQPGQEVKYTLLIA